MKFELINLTLLVLLVYIGLSSILALVSNLIRVHLIIHHLIIKSADSYFTRWIKCFLYYILFIKFGIHINIALFIIKESYYIYYLIFKVYFNDDDLVNPLFQLPILSRLPTILLYIEGLLIIHFKTNISLSSDV
jgi:hypothetical protein